VTGRAKRLLQEALDLPDAERAELAAVLTDSLGEGSLEDDVDATGIAEAKRRLEDIRAGKSKAVPWEDVERDLEEIIEGPDEPERIAR
jgi:putative addiction module component (TIGR02574 family)